MYLSFRYVFVFVFFMILDPENVCLDTKMVFLCELEINILKHVYSGGHFFQNGLRRSQKSMFRSFDVFFVILGPKNVCLDTKIVFPCLLEANY